MFYNFYVFFSLFLLSLADDCKGSVTIELSLLARQLSTAESFFLIKVKKP